MNQEKYEAELGEKIRRVTETIVNLFYEENNRMHMATCVGCLETAKAALIMAQTQALLADDDEDSAYGNLPFNLNQ